MTLYGPRAPSHPSPFLISVKAICDDTYSNKLVTILHDIVSRRMNHDKQPEVRSVMALHGLVD